MIQRLTFSTPRHRELCEVLSDGLAWGMSKAEVTPSGQVAGKSKATVRKEARLKRLLIAVTDPAVEPDLRKRPENARVLKPGGPHAIDFEGDDIKHIIEYLEKVHWGDAQLLDIDELYDFLNTAEEIRPEAQGGTR